MQSEKILDNLNGARSQRRNDMCIIKKDLMETDLKCSGLEEDKECKRCMYYEHCEKPEGEGYDAENICQR